MAYTRLLCCSLEVVQSTLTSCSRRGPVLSQSEEPLAFAASTIGVWSLLFERLRLGLSLGAEGTRAAHGRSPRAREKG